MDVLEEAKEIMKIAGCEKAFAVYGSELDDIAEVRHCSEEGESIELERDINDLVPTIERRLVFDLEKPIECPINSSMNKYLEFFLKNRNIITFNLSGEEFERIEEKINPLLKNYCWSFKKR